MSAYRPVVAFRGEPGTKPPQGGFCVSPTHESQRLYRRLQSLLRCGQGYAYRWLNLAEMCRLLLPRDQILQIKYFTALVNPRRSDPYQRSRQETFLRALATIPSLSI